MAETQKTLFKFTPEAKVGLFVLFGLSLLVYMSLRIGGFTIGSDAGYTVYVSFANAAGLDKDASVRVAGVEVGKITDITLKDSRAKLTLRIKPEIEIGADFTAVLTTKGLLGERYMELLVGSPNAPVLKDGDTLMRTTSYADMDKLITIMSDVSMDIKKVSTTLGNVFGGAEGEATLKNIMTNMEEVSYRVSRLIEKNDEKLDNIIHNLNQFSTLLRDDGPQISMGLKAAVDNLNEGLLETTKNLNSLINENRGNLSEGIENLKLASLKLHEAMENINKMTGDIGPRISDTVDYIGSITQKIDSGEGTIGQLVNDESLHTNINKTVTGINNFIEKAESIKTFVGYRGEYIFGAEETKSYITLKLQPSSDKFYLFEVIDDPRGERSKETRVVTVGGSTTTTTEIKTSDDFKFSLQAAKQFHGLTIRGGLIESTGGLGLDYNLFNNRVQLSFDAFDFDKDDNPHLKAGAMLYFTRYFYLSAGMDDIISDANMESLYFGLGLRFEDDDLKYLFSAAPPISF
ncbi:MAG: MCE family protein [Proteobacteria bacterium]|nr:MCE family protein [Pseudomonadota bacterium]